MAERQSAERPELECHRDLHEVNNEKKIAFVFGRPVLNAAKLQYMPFALSTLKLLAEKYRHIDVYLAQSQTEAYRTLLPAHVNFIFLDNAFVWSQGSGIKLYRLIAPYFNFISRKQKYDAVYGVGQTGVALGGRLAKKNKAKFICLNDEFPDISYLKIWREEEKKYTASADTVILPDESRVAVLRKQVALSAKTKTGVLPNMPLEKDIKALPAIDWRQRLGLGPESKLVVYNGGIDKENNIEFILTVFPFTPANFFMVMVGNGKKYKHNNYLGFDRVLWLEEPLSDDELHTLLAQSVCSLGYYADFLDLEYVGKSSGKIMRSLLLGTPVISTRFDSLKFIETDGMGELIMNPYELVAAIEKIDANRERYHSNIKSHIKKYTFEHYWQQAGADAF